MTKHNRGDLFGHLKVFNARIMSEAHVDVG
jgi:hypothetical protein